MTPEQADSLKSCNGFGKVGLGQWMPYRREGGAYYAPNGLKTCAPSEWRPATPKQIAAEMEWHGKIPINA